MSQRDRDSATLLLADLQTESFRLQQAVASFAALRWAMQDDEQLCQSQKVSMCSVEHDIFRQNMFAIRRTVQMTVKHCMTECVPNGDIGALARTTPEDLRKLREAALCYRTCLIPATAKVHSEVARLKRALIGLNLRYFPEKEQPVRVEAFF